MMEHKTAWIIGSVMLVASVGMVVPVVAEPEPFEAPTTFAAVIPLMDLEGLAQDNALAAAVLPRPAADSALAQVAGAPRDLDALMNRTGMALAGSITPSEVGHFHVALTVSMAVGAAARANDAHVRNYLSTILEMVETLGYPATVLDRVKALANAGKYGDILELLTEAVSDRNLALTIPWTLGAYCGITLAGVLYELPPMLRLGRNSIEGALNVLDEAGSTTPFAGLAKDLLALTSGPSVDHAAVLKAIRTRYQAMGFPD